MKIKKFANFIVPLHIFSSRNMSSLGLVALFFLFYIIAGGSIGTENLKSIKNSKANKNFGVVNEQILVEPTVVQPPPPVKKQEVEKNNEQEADAGWEKLNDKLKGISKN